MEELASEQPSAAPAFPAAIADPEEPEELICPILCVYFNSKLEGIFSIIIILIFVANFSKIICWKFNDFRYEI